MLCLTDSRRRIAQFKEKFISVFFSAYKFSIFFSAFIFFLAFSINNIICLINSYYQILYQSVTQINKVHAIHFRFYRLIVLIIVQCVPQILFDDFKSLAFIMFVFLCFSNDSRMLHILLLISFIFKHW